MKHQVLRNTTWTFRPKLQKAFPPLKLLLLSHGKLAKFSFCICFLNQKIFFVLAKVSHLLGLLKASFVVFQREILFPGLGRASAIKGMEKPFWVYNFSCFCFATKLSAYNDFLKAFPGTGNWGARMFASWRSSPVDSFIILGPRLEIQFRIWIW